MAAVVVAAIGPQGGARFNVGTGVVTSDLELYGVVSLVVGVCTVRVRGDAQHGDVCGRALDAAPTGDVLCGRLEPDLAERARGLWSTSACTRRGARFEAPVPLAGRRIQARPLQGGNTL